MAPNVSLPEAPLVLLIDDDEGDRKHWADALRDPPFRKYVAHDLGQPKCRLHGTLNGVGSGTYSTVVDKNCWIEIYDDDEYDEDDPHVKIQGPAEYATLKDVNGRNWSNDIESVIVGTNATVHAWKDKDFNGNVFYARPTRAKTFETEYVEYD